MMHLSAPRPKTVARPLDFELESVGVGSSSILFRMFAEGQALARWKESSSGISPFRWLVWNLWQGKTCTGINHTFGIVQGPGVVLCHSTCCRVGRLYPSGFAISPRRHYMTLKSVSGQLCWTIPSGISCSSMWISYKASEHSWTGWACYSEEGAFLPYCMRRCPACGRRSFPFPWSRGGLWTAHEYRSFRWIDSFALVQAHQLGSPCRSDNTCTGAESVDSRLWDDA